MENVKTGCVFYDIDRQKKEINNILNVQKKLHT